MEEQRFLHVKKGRRARFAGKGARRGHAAWTRTVAVGSCLLFLCGASVTGAATPGWCGSASQAKKVSSPRDSLQTRGEANETYEYFSDFIISLSCPGTDEKTLLSCDIVLSVRPGVCLTESRVTIRRIIYHIVSDARNHCAGSYEMRKELQKIIREKINESFGREVVEDVYFEKFVIL